MKIAKDVTFEHALTYVGRQIQERFSILPLCEWHHSVNQFQDGGSMNKRININIAMSRATPADKQKYPRLKWKN